MKTLVLLFISSLATQPVVYAGPSKIDVVCSNTYIHTIGYRNTGHNTGQKLLPFKKIKGAKICRIDAAGRRWQGRLDVVMFEYKGTVIGTPLRLWSTTPSSVTLQWIRFGAICMKLHQGSSSKSKYYQYLFEVDTRCMNRANKKANAAKKNCYKKHPKNSALAEACNKKEFSNVLKSMLRLNSYQMPVR